MATRIIAALLTLRMPQIMDRIDRKQADALALVNEQRGSKQLDRVGEKDPHIATPTDHGDRLNLRM